MSTTTAILSGIAAAVWTFVGALVWLIPVAQPPQEVQAAYAPTSSREQFAVDLLAALGNTQPTMETVAMVVEWTTAEDGSDGALLRNNPLNTTMCGYNMTGAINGDGACGVQGYATYQDGLAATVATLAQQNFSAIAQALLANDAEGARQALWASPWAASHYGYGASWPRVELQGGNNQGDFPLDKSVVTESMVVSAGFYATGAPAWAGQGGMHYGVDYACPRGCPVYMPFDCVYTMTGFYGDSGRYGQYLMCDLLDGYKYYSGHLESVQEFAPGALIPAGTQIGFTNELDHTHIQLTAPSGALVDFEEYFAAH